MTCTTKFTGAGRNHVQRSTTIDRANYLMWVAHNLERVADRVTNICERTVYTATGQLMEFAPSDDESVAPF